MTIDTTRAKKLAAAIKTVARAPELLQLCDYVLAEKAEKKQELPAGEPTNIIPLRKVEATCPVCEARRFAKAAAMRRWRGKRGSAG